MTNANTKRTSSNQYRTDENGEYSIYTCQLHEGDWIATTHEFRAFGKTEYEALVKLGRFMREAGDSIDTLALRLLKSQPEIKHPTDPPCQTCGEYDCTKHNVEEA